MSWTDMIVEFIKINLIISFIVTFLEDSISCLLSVRDYSKYLKTEEKISLSDNLIKSLYVNIFKDSLLFRFDFEKNKDPHVYVSLICMFILWPIHFIGCIFLFSISDLRSLIINEYKSLYKKYDMKYAMQ